MAERRDFDLCCSNGYDRKSATPKAVFSLDEVHTHIDYFEVKAVPVGPNPAKRNRIEVIARLEHLPAGTTADTLVIGTDWPNAKEFKVPMTILMED